MIDSQPSVREHRMRTMHARLLGAVPRVRADDLMTEDHPIRRFDAPQRRRFNAWLRAAAFLGVMAVATFLIGGVLLLAFVMFTAGGDGLDSLTSINTSDQSSPQALLSLFGEIAGAIVAYLVVVIAMEGRRVPVELSPSRAFDLVRGAVVAFVCIAVCIGIIALFGGYRIVGFNTAYSPWADLILLGLTAGVVEEITMRGILLRLLEEAIGSWGAVVVSALVFGLMHVSNPDGTLWGGVAIMIEAGLLFGAIYLATRSLWWCIGFHFMWNVAEGPIFGSIVSGRGGAQQSWLIAQWQGPELLTGGSFGLEASLVPVVLLGALAIAVLVHLQRLGRMIEPVWIQRRRLAGNLDPAGNAVAVEGDTIQK